MKVCKALQAKCMALKAVAEQKTCMHAATKELQEKMKTLDFCAQAPSHIAQKCQYEQKKCMTISSDKEKQKACWEGKMKELMAEANRGSGSGSSTDVCAIALNMVCVCVCVCMCVCVCARACAFCVYIISMCDSVYVRVYARAC